MDDVQDLKRTLDDIFDQVRDLRQAQGRIPLRVPPGGGGGGAATTIYSASNYTALTALITSKGLTDPALGYTADNDHYYRLETGTWRVVGAFRMASAPSSIGEREGDIWEETDVHKIYWHNGTTWKEFSSDHRVNAGKGEWYNGSSWTVHTHFA